MKHFSYLKLYIIAVLLIHVYKIVVCKTYVSHKKEPKVGDKVINNNSSCKHFKSAGTVVEIQNIENDAGKIVVYRVENNGKTFDKGQILHKTLDQVTNY